MKPKNRTIIEAKADELKLGTELVGPLMPIFSIKFVWVVKAIDDFNVEVYGGGMKLMMSRTKFDELMFWKKK